MKARFKVGTLKKEDREKEIELEREMLNRNKLRKEKIGQNQNYTNNFELENNEEMLSKILGDIEMDPYMEIHDISNIENAGNESRFDSKRERSDTRTSSPIRKSKRDNTL